LRVVSACNNYTDSSQRLTEGDDDENDATAPDFSVQTVRTTYP